MRRLFIAAALVATMLVPSQALASSHHPTGDYANFGECPLSHPTVIICVYSKSSGGFFQIGKKTVPLKNPVTLQGGLEFNEAAESTFVGAENGETLSKTPQPVPGGLLGIEAPASWPSFLRNLFNETINNGFTGVTATVELAAPASQVKVNPINVLFETGTGVSLPVKIKLSNPFLGSNCYIGSNSSPVVIDFTSGETSPPPPNEPIHGSAGAVSVNEAETVVTLTGGQLVNNSFGAPGANGCGGLFSFLVDPFVNSLVGLPSPAGTNTAILEGLLQTGVAEAVKASE
ncbi:MAG TPA: hypothetical protein VFN89_01405 [Solirubrobacterales bacterium]|nr:hypothetical protein [Solirubrobacterales bacterium]